MRNKDKLSILVNRLNRIGINIELSANIPWIYLSYVNGHRISEVGNGGNHGYVIAWYSVRADGEIRLTENMGDVFKLIRKYVKKF